MNFSALRSSLLFVFVAGTVSTLAACATSTLESDDTVSDSSELRALTPAEIIGPITVGETLGPVDHPGAPRYRAYSFEAEAGATYEVWVRSTDGDAMAFVTDATWKTLARNDDADATTHDARVTAKAKTTGTHYVVFRERDSEPATFTVSVEQKVASPAPPAPGAACAFEHEIASEPCGFCGKREAICLDGQWSEWSVCVFEVPNGCLPGTVETTDAGCTAGTVRERVCTSFCAWGPFSATCAPSP